MILDASFPIDPFDGDPDAVAKYDSIRGEPMAIPSIVGYEVGWSAIPDEQARLARVRENVAVLGFDADAMDRTTAIQSDLTARGVRKGHRDVMIAATGLEADHGTIVTGNASDFAPIPITVETY